MNRVSLLRRISFSEISVAAHAIWWDKSIADTIALETARIINQTYARKFVFFNGKSSKCLIGGLFYILSYRYDAAKKQNQLDTSEVTIRASYRKWLETFPDLFLDVIGKFSTKTTLRSFVLLDLKKSVLKSENKGTRYLPAAP